MYNKSFILTEPERAISKAVALELASTVNPVLDIVKAHLMNGLSPALVEPRVLKVMLEFTIEEIIKHNG